MLRVGLFCERPLGESVLRIVRSTPGVDVVGVVCRRDGWWGSAGELADDDVFGARPDLVLSVLTRHIFTAAEIAVCPILNLHLAPLPAYRGCNGPAHALLNLDSHYGATLHVVDEGIDTGPIVARTRFPIPPGCTGRGLYDLASASALLLFGATWTPIAHGSWSSTPQAGPARYHRRDSLAPYMDRGDDPVVARALDFPPFPAPR